MAPIEIPNAVIDALRHARHIAVLTGAGVSAESGVPTFRDAQTGLWSKFNPQELATREAFARNPKVVWEWYAYRRARVEHVAPNAGHYALAEMEKRVAQFTLITQNIDGLHERAGSRNIIELHGNIRRAKCFAEDVPVARWIDDGQIPPRCPRCGAYLRPDVVWFGEMLPPSALDAAFRAAQTCDVFFSIGTSGVVEPAASLPFLALRNGAVVIEVNPDATPFSASATLHLAAPSGIALPRVVECAWTADVRWNTARESG
ncbi:MAG: NAD-dependent deacylase [Chloroflexi bacterium]|nr:NAD-dependent deacylase [Chloroflexota bacterium]